MRPSEGSPVSCKSWGKPVQACTRLLRRLVPSEDQTVSPMRGVLQGQARSGIELDENSEPWILKDAAEEQRQHSSAKPCL